jgi:hypothetical protein
MNGDIYAVRMQDLQAGEQRYAGLPKFNMALKRVEGHDIDLITIDSRMAILPPPTKAK